MEIVGLRERFDGRIDPISKGLHPRMCANDRLNEGLIVGGFGCDVSFYRR